MKRLKNILISCACALPVLLAVGCGGEDTPNVKSDPVVLIPSRTSIIANGTDRVTFKVESGTTDVTSRSKISVKMTDGQQQEIDGAAFTTKTAGEYVFTATYDSKKSEEVKVTAQAAVAEKYYRRVCMMDATGTWCTNCPDATRALSILSTNRPDRLIILALHGESKDKDVMTTPVTEMLNKIHQITAYPQVVTDLRDVVTGNTIAGEVSSFYNVSRNDYPATCGLRMESKYNATTGKIDITVGVTSNTGGDYRLAVLIVEDGIVEPQLDRGYWTNDYVHNDVVRTLLSSNLIGDALGTLDADKEVTKDYSVAVDEGWKVDNLRVVAYATDSSQYVNNIIECEAKDGSCDYKLND